MEKEAILPQHEMNMLAILHALEEADEPLWKSKIRDRANEIRGRVEGTRPNVHRSTIGRRIDEMFKEGLVKKKFLPEERDTRAEVGYDLTEDGESYLDSYRVDWYAEAAGNSLRAFIWETFRVPCSECPIDEEECFEEARWRLTKGFEDIKIDKIDKELVEAAIDNAESAKDVKLAAALLSAYAFFTKGGIEMQESKKKDRKSVV